MKKRIPFIMLVSVLLLGVAAADDVLAPSWPCGTNGSALAQYLCRLLYVPDLSQEAICGLREMPLMTNLAVLARIDPLTTDMKDHLLASSVFSALSLRRFSRADIPVLSNEIEAIRKQWSSLDPGEDPVARTGFREISEALEFIVPTAQAQVRLAESLEVLTTTTSSVRAIVFNLAGFDPAVRSVDSTIVSLLVSEATPVCDSLLPRGKPVPFSQYWSPDEYRWRDVALNNAHQARVLIFLNRDEPLLYVLLLPGGLWIGPCGVSSTPIAFSFGPNPPQSLYEALDQVATGPPAEGTELDGSSSEAVGHLSSEIPRDLDSMVLPDVKIVDATPQAVIEYIEGLLPQSVETVTRPSIHAFQKRGAGRYSAELHNETAGRVIDHLMRLIGCSYAFLGEGHFCVRLSDSPITSQTPDTSSGSSEDESFGTEEEIGFE